MYDQIFILRSVLEVVRAEVRLAGRVETGGAMVGFLSLPNSLVITHVSGPGPRGELNPTNVLIDGQYAYAFCTQMFDDSGGQLDYVGEWHRHPGWSLAASGQDLEAMLTISRSKCCSVKYPVSAIYRLQPERMVAYALENRRLKRVRIKWVDTAPRG
jgi:integrative and conjugative element protein (TIGR02256 family)